MSHKKLTDSEELIYFGAFRYSLGRRTYMPGVVSEEIMKHASEFSPRAKEIFIKGVMDCLSGGWYGDGCDKVTWEKFLTFWKNYPEE